jgi:hypothetical protein
VQVAATASNKAEEVIESLGSAVEKTGSAVPGIEAPTRAAPAGARSAKPGPVRTTCKMNTYYDLMYDAQ